MSASYNKYTSFIFLLNLSYISGLLSCVLRAENMARKSAGEEPLPEEDPSNQIFKPIPEPSRLDSFLITNQTANYCNLINGYVALFEVNYHVLNIMISGQNFLCSNNGFLVAIGYTDFTPEIVK